MCPEHQKLLLQRQEHLLAELAERSKEGFQKAQEEHERNVRLWQQRQDKAKGGAKARALVQVRLPLKVHLRLGLAHLV